MKTAAIVALLATGCSFIGVRGPPRPCTDTMIPPAIDAVFGAALVAAGLVAVRTSIPEADEGSAVSPLPFLGVAAVMSGFAIGISAAVGYSRVTACRAEPPPTVSARDAQEARDQEGRDAQAVQDAQAAREPCLRQRAERLRDAANIADASLRAVTLASIPECAAAAPAPQRSPPVVPLQP